MKVHIFILEDQIDLAKTIGSLLREEIYRDVDVQILAIDPKYNEKSMASHEFCKEYLKCLRASIAVSNPFEIVIKNEWGTQWCYLGHTPEFPNCCFELNQKQMTALFPAVAVMNRIVMLPEEFCSGLDTHPRTFLSLPRPLDLAGVSLVDFGSKELLTHAVRRVGVQLKQEWRNLCHHQMAVRRLFKPDFDELGRLLKIDSSVLEGNSIFASDVRLDASIVDGKAVEDEPSRVVLELRNLGGRALTNIRVRVTAPLNVMLEPVSKITDLVPPGTVRLELHLTPRVAPCCPLEVFVDQGDDPLAVPSFPMPILLDVLPQNSP